MTYFTLTDSDYSEEDHLRDLKGGGVLLAQVRHDGMVSYYASERTEFKRRVDEIIAWIIAKKTIALEEERRRANTENLARQETIRRETAESQALSAKRVAEAECALIEGLSYDD